MSVRVLRLADYRAMPWRNGLGLTREVAALVDPNDAAQFLWRISIATVSASGPFSVFPGIDRTIAVLDGEGMALDVAGEAVALTRRAPPFSFSGEAAVYATVSGETTDLNVMTRHDAFVHRVERRDAAGFRRIADADSTAIICNGPATIEVAGEDHACGRYEGVTGISRGTDFSLTVQSDVDVFVIRLDRR